MKFRFIEWHKYIRNIRKIRKPHNRVKHLPYIPVFLNGATGSNNDDVELEKLKKRRNDLRRR